MINGQIGIRQEVSFEIVKFSKKRGTEERFFSKNVVLDLGFETWAERWLEEMAGSAQPEFLYLGSGTSEPTRDDLGLEAISTTAPPRLSSSNSYLGFIDRDPATGTIWTEKKGTHVWGEGEAIGTWTEAGLAFWDLIGTSSTARGDANTYTHPYSRSLFRKGLERDSGTASAGGATTLSDSTKAWTVDAWKDNYTVYITGGTGAGQSREITGNTATELTVAAWDTQPDATSVYAIRGTPTSITVLADEFLTVFSYMRIYLPHKLDHWSGTFLWKTYEVPWIGYVTENYITETGFNVNGAISRGPVRQVWLISNGVGAISQTRFPDRLVNVATKTITAAINVEPAASNRSINAFWMNSSTSVAGLRAAIVIEPDWSVLPEVERWGPSIGTSGEKLMLPAGQRFQGSISWTLFRAD